jgi:asparaginyl-tRNA synthetase
VRRQKNITFIDLSDGSSVAGAQLVCDAHAADASAAVAAAATEERGLATGASVAAECEVRVRPGAEAGAEAEASADPRRQFDLVATRLQVLGGSDASYPLQKKFHTLEAMREKKTLHLRLRTNVMGAVMRARNALAMGTHDFFQQRGFLWVHTPIITPLDCEGAGELFSVVAGAPKQQQQQQQQHFFHVPTFLTVSGQLHAEMAACALGAVYTFGPTFRAENSNTARHLAEFWMIEPEVAFASLDDVVGVAGDLLRHSARVMRERCAEEVDFFAARVDAALPATLERLAGASPARLTYTEAVEVLRKRHAAAPFEVEPRWGEGLSSEHERFLAEAHCEQRAVAVTHYPKAIKPFYMREAPPQPGAPAPTVECFDLLVPRVGELVGGSAREDDAARLSANLTRAGLSTEPYEWYLDLRRYGSVQHAGFGMGFERLVLLLTGMHNVRDVVMVPRVPGVARL